MEDTNKAPQDLISDERGATFIEYVLLAVGAVVVMYAAWTGFNTQLGQGLTTTGNAVQNGAPAALPPPAPGG